MNEPHRKPKPAVSPKQMRQQYLFWRKQIDLLSPGDPQYEEVKTKYLRVKKDYDSFMNDFDMGE